jgi:hypothetical protein
LSHRASTRLQPYVRWGAFCALILLQLLNLFWYYLILRIVAKCVELFPYFNKYGGSTGTPPRVVLTSKAEDVRSDDEDDGEEDASTAKPLYPAQGHRFAQEITSEDSSAKEKVEETPKALTR